MRDPIRDSGTRFGGGSNLTVKVRAALECSPRFGCTERLLKDLTGASPNAIRTVCRKLAREGFAEQDQHERDRWHAAAGRTEEVAA